ncbi:MAG: NAD(P)-dependent oxidoreductase [Planctomycetota bacterium]
MSDSASSQAKRTVLVTGSSGCVGRVVVHGLREAGHTVHGLDRVPHGDIACETLGDIAEADTWERAFAQADGNPIDTLVHLAAHPFADGNFLEDLLAPNVIGLFRALESAAGHGVSRVVLASTLQVASGITMPSPDDGASPRVSPEAQSPTNAYAVTKCMAEHFGRIFARKRLCSVIAARIGWFMRRPEHQTLIEGHPRGQEVYVSHRDLSRFFVAAVEAEHAGFGCYWCMSAGTAVDSESLVDGSPYDFEPGRVALGFEPIDRLPDGSDWPLLEPVSELHA